MSSSMRSQRGVALLTILLLVVSITVVAGAMLASQKIAIRRSGLLFDQDQLLQDIDTGRQMAVTVIRTDHTLNDTDSGQDIWAQPIPPYTIGNHSISLEIRDEAGRFNINNLYQNGTVNTAALAVFQRLLGQLNLEPETATAVIDYQDTDRDVYQDGGEESAVYAQQLNSTSMTSLPNQPFISIEQLYEVRGVSAEVLAALRPYVTAVPYYVPININTASPVLLAALVDGATSQQMQALVEVRMQRAFTSIDEVWQTSVLGTLEAEQRAALTPLLAVDSSAFTALITASDNPSSSQSRQRFATVLIGKTLIEDNQNATSSNTSIGNSSNESSNEKMPKEVTVIMQRLWAFRPSF